MVRYENIIFSFRFISALPLYNGDLYMKENEPKELNDENQSNSNSSDSLNSAKRIIVYKGDKYRPTMAEWILIAITIVLAICNIIIINYASNQSKAAIDAVNLAKNQFNYQRKQDSIRTIQQNIKDSIFYSSQHIRDSLNYNNIIIENRAYVDIADIRGLYLKVNQPIAIDSLILVNTGKTPAYNVRVATGIIIGTGIYPNEIKDIDKQVLSAPEFTIGAGQTSLSSLTKEYRHMIFRKQDSTNIFSNKYTLFYFGKITYKDKFRKQHFTRFAVQFEFGRIWSFFQYKYFNDGD